MKGHPMKYEAGNQNSSRAPALFPERIVLALFALAFIASGQKQFAREPRTKKRSEAEARVDQIISAADVDTRDTKRA
jgi:hypothetical protein